MLTYNMEHTNPDHYLEGCWMLVVHYPKCPGWVPEIHYFSQVVYPRPRDVFEEYAKRKEGKPIAEFTRTFHLAKIELDVVREGLTNLP